MSFSPGFIGHLWSTAVQDELPFAAIQRTLPQIAFPDVFAGRSCLSWLLCHV